MRWRSNMKGKGIRFYLGTLAGLGTILWAATLCFGPGTGVAHADYTEECLNEGCNGEEVQELYNSYQEECLNEGCSKEEVLELGGSPQGVQAMKAEFLRRGFRINPSDFEGTGPNCLGTTTYCTGFLLWCNDHCVFPDGSMSSTYLCGGCFGFWW
jgi:hypothetical protein